MVVRQTYDSPLAPDSPREFQHLSRFKYTPQESSFDVDLVEYPTVDCCNVGDSPERFHSHSGGSRFVVVDPIDCGVAFDYEASFPSDGISMLVTFQSEHKLPVHDCVTIGFALGNKSEDTEVGYGAQFLVTSSQPFGGVQ